jgi:Tol biopolymer transport system component
MIGLVLVVVLVGVLIYFLLFRTIKTDTNNQNNTNNGNINSNGQLPDTNTNRVVNRNTNQSTSNNNGTTLPDIAQIAAGGATLVNDVTSTRVSSGKPTADRTGYVYYDRDAKKFYNVGLNGEKTELSNQAFYEVNNIVWSASGQTAILSYPDGSKVFFDFRTNQATTLPKEMKEVSFSGNGDKIAYEFVGTSDSERWLAVSKPDGSEQQIIEPIGDKAASVEVNWSPDSQVVATYRESVGVNQEEIYFIGQNGENFKSMVVDGSGFTSKWSPDGKQLLYSVYNSASGYRPTLWLASGQRDSVGANAVNLQIATWPSKCAFGAVTIYCAVPTTLPEGAGLAPEVASMTPDAFYQIDLATGQKSLLAVPASIGGQNQYSADVVYVSLDETQLYFHNTISGKLETIRLK